MAVGDRSLWLLEKEALRTRCSDCFSGENVIHSKGTVYLPALDKQSDTQYAAYVKRARFLNVVKRTARGFEGMVFRKEPTLTYPRDDEKIEGYLNNIDNEGLNLSRYAKKVFVKTIVGGFSCTLVEVPEVEEKDGIKLSMADAEALGVRPYLAFYSHEKVRKLKYATVKNVKMLIYAELEEFKDVSDDHSTEDFQRTFRVLELLDGVYTQHVVDEDGNSEPNIVPKMKGKPLDYIPLYVHGNPEEEPPLDDLASNNIHHYMLKATHNHGLHWAGLPTPTWTGIDHTAVDEKGKPLEKPTAVGPHQGVYLSDPAAKAFYMEFEGKGLTEVTKELDYLERHMAYLGASLLAPDPARDETATKAKIRNAAETATVSSVAEDVSDTMNEALQTFGAFLRCTEDITIQLSKDYMPVGLTADDAVKLVTVWQGGGMSEKELFSTLQRGEIQDGEKTFDEHQSELTEEGFYERKKLTDDLLLSSLTKTTEDDADDKSGGRTNEPNKNKGAQTGDN